MSTVLSYNLRLQASGACGTRSNTVASR